MFKDSAEGQITLPANIREAIGIKLGDEIEIYALDDQINIVKKMPDAAKSILRYVNSKAPVSDEESRESALL